jgi:hypothetical protein
MRSDLSVCEKALSPSMSSRDHDRMSSHHFHSAWSLTLRGHQGRPRDHTQACHHPRGRWGHERLRERVAHRATAHVQTPYKRSPYPQLEPVMTQPQHLFIPADAGEKVILPGIEITIRSCPSSVRVNIRGLPGHRHKGKKAETRGLLWPPSGPLSPGDALDAGHAPTRRLLRPLPRAASYHPTCSYPRWLRPRRDAKE